MLAIKRCQSMAEFVNSSACVCVSVCMLARVCVCCACLCATDATLKAHSAQRQRTEIVEKVQQSRAAYVPQVRANKMAAAQTNHKQQQWPTMTQAPHAKGATMKTADSTELRTEDGRESLGSEVARRSRPSEHHLY